MRDLGEPGRRGDLHLRHRALAGGYRDGSAASGADFSRYRLEARLWRAGRGGAGGCGRARAGDPTSREKHAGDHETKYRGDG